MSKIKWIASLSFFIAMMLGIVACNQNTGSQPKQGSQPNQEPSPKSIISTTSIPPPNAKDLLSRVKIVTEDYRPYNFIDSDGKLKGSSTEKVNAAIEKLGVKIPIEVYPWNRSYSMTLADENTLIYSIGRTAQRENLFKWIVPVGSVNVYFYGLERRQDIQNIQSLEELKKYRIAAVVNDLTEQGLKKNGFKDQIVSEYDMPTCIKSIFAKRADLWVTSMAEESMLKECKTAGFDGKQLKSFYMAKELKTDLWIAANPKTSDEIIKLFKEALQ